MAWTDQRIATLKDLWKDGYSASQISSKLATIDTEQGAVTRNAVIGKVHRLKLGRSTHPHLSHTSRPHQPRLPKPKAAATPTQPRRASITRLGLPELTPAPDHTVTVQELTASTCRWPIGDPKQAHFHFCGRAAHPGLPYCPHHYAVGTQQTSKRATSTAPTDHKQIITQHQEAA